MTKKNRDRRKLARKAKHYNSFLPLIPWRPTPSPLTQYSNMLFSMNAWWNTYKLDIKPRT